MRRAIVLFVAATGCSTPAQEPTPVVETVVIDKTPAPSPAPKREVRGVPDAIETEGVPEVPADLVERLRQYQNVRGAGLKGWAPDGKSLLIATRFAATVQLHRVYEPGGRREQLTFFEEPVGEAEFLDDHSIVLTMGRGGNEVFQIYRLDLASGRTTILTDGISRHETGAVSRAKTKIVSGINAPGARDTDLYVVDLSGKSKPELLLETHGESWNATDWSPDDSKVVLAHFVSATESSLHVMDLATKKLTALPVPEGRKVSIEDAKFTGDGRGLYVASDAAGEFKALGRVDLTTTETTWLTSSIPWDVATIEVSRDGKRVAFATNEDGASKLYFLEDGRPREVPLPLAIVGDLKFSPDSRRLAMTLSRPDAPSDVYVLDEAGKLERWTYGEVGGLDRSKFVTAERISWPTFDGREIPGYVTRPAKRHGRLPVLIDIHGGPEGQHRPFFNPQTQFLALELGIAVVNPNVRGSTGYGRTFTSLDDAALREDSVRDIGALLDWIAKQPDLDASRVGVTGGSYGGYMSLATLTHFSDRVRAGIDFVGITNFATFLKNTSAYRQDLRRVEYGDERDPAMAAKFEEISPANHADRIHSALLVAHGVNDPRVPISEARQIAGKVRAAGGKVWTVYAANEGHGFGKKENRDFLAAVTVLFLEENLLGEAHSGSR